MNGWFIAIVVLQVLNIGIHLAKHGENTNSKFNFYSVLVVSLISLFLIYMAIQTGF